MPADRRAGRANSSRLGTALAAAFLPCALAVAQGHPAQGQPAHPPKLQPFALPHELTFPLIENVTRRINCQISQVRRVFQEPDADNPQGQWIGISEEFRHRAPTETRPESFSIIFQGFETGILSLEQHALAAQRHEANAKFFFFNQGFRVTDANLASENYRLQFLAVSYRIERLVYRVAVLPRFGSHSRWVLDLDVATGYPLYWGEYNEKGVLVSEVEAQRFDPAFSGTVEQASDLFVSTGYPSATAAITALGLSGSAAPGSGVLPSGFVSSSSRVVTNVVSGERKAVLISTDGVSDLVLVIGEERNSPLATVVRGHVITRFDDAGNITQYQFAHNGVDYLIVGKGKSVRGVTTRLYAQAIRNDR